MLDENSLGSIDGIYPEGYIWFSDGPNLRVLRKVLVYLVKKTIHGRRKDETVRS